MVQRLDICGNYIAEPCEDGAYIKYEDYEDLHAVLCLLIDQVNPPELPDSLCEKLEAMGLL